MTDPADAKTTERPKFIDITLEEPIIRGDQTITSVKVRKPESGELRGLTLVDVANLDVNALIKLLPRITTPMLTGAEVAALDPADLLSLGSEVSGFLSTRQMRASQGL